MFTLILLVFAFVLACISAWLPEPSPNRHRLISAALAFYFLACVLNNSVISQHLPR